VSDDLVPIDDPRVTEYRRWLHDADQWRATRAERRDAEAARDAAGELIGRFGDLMIATPFLDIMGKRMAAEWETAAVNPDWSKIAANQRRLLLALGQAIIDFGRAFLPAACPHCSPSTSSRVPKARRRSSARISHPPAGTATTRS
jgi:hypothetical protein